MLLVPELQSSAPEKVFGLLKHIKSFKGIPMLVVTIGLSNKDKFHAENQSSSPGLILFQEQ